MSPWSLQSALSRRTKESCTEPPGLFRRPAVGSLRASMIGSAHPRHPGSYTLMRPMLDLLRSGSKPFVLESWAGTGAMPPRDGQLTPVSAEEG